MNEMIRKRSFVMLVILVIQFLLGMSMNLFAVLPSDPKFASENIFLKLILPAHVIVAIFLLLGSIFIFIFSRRIDNPSLIKIAGQGMGSVITAIVSGLLTVFFVGILSEVFSFLMALAFLNAFIAYIRLYYLT